MEAMERIFLSLGLLLALSAPLAAENIEGYLVDKACAAEVIKEGGDAARAHTKECALMPDCKASGYGLVTADGKFLKFDKDGDSMAAKVLGFTTRKDGLKVVVSGEVQGDAIAVKAIQLS